MRPAIGVDNLSKQYQLGTRQRSGDGLLRDTLATGVRNLWGRLRGRPRAAQVERGAGTFWALEDVSFEVRPGEVLGIIGRNGAGKSTLLKILSRVVEPTAGRAAVRGRLGSLLEVGTGFHPELTGRENIYLNGSILGMSRREINRKFDEIVAFSEVEKFLDMPVKRYSSGMHVRLAFAVAAHLEPEILVVDEVLAVGDAAFQNKCLGKMREVGREGRTILLVSHQMASLAKLCTSVLWLAQGRVEAIGEPQALIRRYLASSAADDTGGRRDLRSAPRPWGDQKVRFQEIRLLNSAGEATGFFPVGDQVEIAINLESEIAGAGEVGYTVKTLEGVELFTSSSNDGGCFLDIKPGSFELRSRIDPNYLRPGKYLIQVGVTVLTCRDLIPDAIVFEVIADRHFCSDGPYVAVPQFQGHFFFPYPWEACEGTNFVNATATTFSERT